MANPHRKIIAPAAACIHRSRTPNRAIRSPADPNPTTANIVPIVAKANTTAIRMTVRAFNRAAGYIRRGMRGSQGPKTKSEFGFKRKPKITAGGRETEAFLILDIQQVADEDGRLQKSGEGNPPFEVGADAAVLRP